MRSIKPVPTLESEIRPLFKSIALLLQTTMDQEIEAVKLQARIEFEKMAKETQQHDEYISAPAAMILLECKERKLASLRKSGLLVYRKHGKPYQYLKSSVDSCTNLPQAKKRSNGR